MSKELTMFMAKEEMDDGSIKKYVGFVGGPFSNFFIINFVCNGVLFNCVEQFFHWKKAVHFKDEETANKILAEKEPKKQKSLGRSVKNFNQQEWEEISYNVMLEGLYAKFSTEGLKQVLLQTGDANIEECAPYDNFWGTKRSCDQALSNTSPVNGKNRLGEALMETRRRLLV